MRVDNASVFRVEYVLDISVIVRYRFAFACFCQRDVSSTFKHVQDFPVAIIIGPCRPPRRVLNTEGEIAPAASLNDIANRIRYSPSSPACFGATEGFLEGFSRLSPLHYGREICQWRLMASPRCVSRWEGRKRR